ncbi:hypothetical protein J8273_5232 [Carpediemonas membranifera]|uniref:DNA-directed RNA polymerase subunit beta n=1 Tax=Carpediemonas membranifera TaxID=201153 RepID=A0A8J6B8K0_9EUKA|nr:hypothetical protein J8273_5232 [Carpediemonas membranifera]|eukprot:KAG9392247.1 hypothetical protein J8273_5232 [Carpediemonas membranifera]
MAPMSANTLDDGPDPMKALFSNHVDSFNHFTEHLMPIFPQMMEKVDVDHESLPYMRLSISDISLGYPTRMWDDDKDPLFPSECREARLTYGAPLRIKVLREILDGDSRVDEIDFNVGELPVMTCSDHCHLNGLTPDQLIAQHEERREQGGFFIVNGNEKCLRMFVVNRRHYPFAVHRSAFQKRGRDYTPYGVMIRCVMPDETSTTNVLHYLTDGSSRFRIILDKQEYFIPLVLLMRALVPVTDQEIYDAVVGPDPENTFLSERILKMVTNSHGNKIFTQEQALAFIGSKFRVVMRLGSRHTDADVGRKLINQFVLIHLNSYRDKFNLLVQMVRKLYGLAQGTVMPDSMDTSMAHELLMPGNLVAMFVKEQLTEWLHAVSRGMLIHSQRHASVDMASVQALRDVGRRHGFDIGQKLQFLLATGNLVSRSGLDLLQVAGLSIVAEKLNYQRYLSHFRGVHRGSFFVDSKDVTVRRLLPESWGFLCPIHTPDGPSCGLACHLAQGCIPTLVNEDTSAVPDVLVSLGMVPLGDRLILPVESHCPVLLDGAVIGHLAHNLLPRVVSTLRVMKVRGEANIPPHLEIGAVDPALPRQMAMLAMFSGRARYSRPVLNLGLNAYEFIGSFEQVFMNIAVTPDDIRADTTHMEITPTEMLDVIAALTPYSDYNQSPRCMYQCVMGKQTMATPVHSFPYRTDNKMYRIQSPQLPVVETDAQGRYGFNEYPHGTNAVVAVLSYTGYDMEDAMIINQGAWDRGMFAGTVYVTKDVTLVDKRARSASTQRFSNVVPDTGAKFCSTLDVDGLAMPGQRLVSGDAMACIFDTITGEFHLKKYKGEDAIVEDVRLLGHGTKDLVTARYKLRHIRRPTIGDKFSSRHGQKGVLSVLWPHTDFPFTESGIVPDCLINPHAFPSRMTIGMLMESIAGKSSCLHAVKHDATPFKYDEVNRASEAIGEELRAAGYSHYGTETMYSGVYGTQLVADIFIGVVYYQRLRHMVSDKYQVRATGPVNQITRQPIKGRKAGGGIRFGEMERDSLISHGVAYMLQDRTFMSSDYSEHRICQDCGNVVAIGNEAAGHYCRLCRSRSIRWVSLPYILVYLAHELAGMNVQMSLLEHVRE